MLRTQNSRPHASAIMNLKCTWLSDWSILPYAQNSYFHVSHFPAPLDLFTPPWVKCFFFFFVKWYYFGAAFSRNIITIKKYKNVVHAYAPWQFRTHPRELYCTMYTKDQRQKTRSFFGSFVSATKRTEKYKKKHPVWASSDHHHSSCHTRCKWIAMTCKPCTIMRSMSHPSWIRAPNWLFGIIFVRRINEIFRGASGVQSSSAGRSCPPLLNS